jgi:hypothetical protein
MIAIAANSMPTFRSYSERYSGMGIAYERPALRFFRPPKFGGNSSFETPIYVAT